MNGDMALAYSRERYNLEEGDFDRGKNHTRVMTGIIKKLLSPAILINFDEISQSALKSVNTDMTSKKMIELVNGQLAYGGDWDIDSQALKGTGSMDLPSALMPEARLYMMVADEASIKSVHDNIENNNKVVK